MLSKLQFNCESYKMCFTYLINCCLLSADRAGPYALKRDKDGGSVATHGQDGVPTSPGGLVVPRDTPAVVARDTAGGSAVERTVTVADEKGSKDKSF